MIIINEVIRRCPWKLLCPERLYAIFPCQVDDLFMCQHRIASHPLRYQQCQQHDHPRAARRKETMGNKSFATR